MPKELVTPIIVKHGFYKWERAYNLAEVALDDGVRSHLEFANNVKGVYGFTINELCTLFNFARWMNRV